VGQRAACGDHCGHPAAAAAERPVRSYAAGDPVGQRHRRCRNCQRRGDRYREPRPSADHRARSLSAAPDPWRRGYPRRWTVVPSPDDRYCALMPTSQETMIDAGGRELRVSSPDREIFPATERTPSITKLDIVKYYLAVD